MNEASWLIGGGGSNPGQSIEVGYFSGYWGYSPGSGWFSGLLPYYTLNDGYGPAVRGSTYLPAGTGMTFDAISGGRAKVASYNTTYFNQTFTYAVSDGLNFAQGEVLNSTATWLGGGSTNGFSGYWTNNGVNWYYWGNQSKCANSPYWDILQANPWDYRNGGY